MYCTPLGHLPTRRQKVPDPEPAKLSGIKTALLIPGRGEPIKHGAVVIHEDKIAWAGPQSALPLKYSAMAFTEVPVLLPALWVVTCTSTATHRIQGPQDTIKL
jgi:hypothetical protein